MDALDFKHFYDETNLDAKENLLVFYAWRQTKLIQEVIKQIGSLQDDLKLLTDKVDLALNNLAGNYGSE